jgi:hypothetical protein
MSSSFFIIAALLTLLFAGILFWTFRGNGFKRPRVHGMAALYNAPRHQRNLSQIKQAMDSSDLAYAGSQGGDELANRLRHERKRVTFLYLDAIQSDFDQSLRVARVIAALSPEVSGAQEYDRLRLAITFRCKLQAAKVRLAVGIFSQVQVAGLGEMAASLAMQM